MKGRKSDQGRQKLPPTVSKELLAQLFLVFSIIESCFAFEKIQVRTIPAKKYPYLPPSGTFRMCFVKDIPNQLAGSFLLVQEPQQGSVTKQTCIHFLDLSLEPSYYNGAANCTITDPETAVGSLDCPFYLSKTGSSSLIFPKQINSANEGTLGFHGYGIARDPMTQSIGFTGVQKTLTVTGSPYVAIHNTEGSACGARMVNDDLKMTLPYWGGSSAMSFTNNEIASIPIPGTTLTGPIDMAFYIGPYWVFFLQDGKLVYHSVYYFGTPSTCSEIPTKCGFLPAPAKVLPTDPPLSPVYVRRDMSASCDFGTSCYALIGSIDSTGTYRKSTLSRVKIILQGNDPTLWKVEIVGAIVIQEATNKDILVRNVVQLGSNKIVLFALNTELKIYSFNDSGFSVVSNLVPNSYNVGGNTRILSLAAPDPTFATSPEIPLAVLLDPSGTGLYYTTVMAKFSFDDGCTIRDVGSNYCMCSAGFFTTATGRCARCESEGCSICKNDGQVCTECMATHMLSESKCYHCGVSFVSGTNKVLVVSSDLLSLVCVDKTTEPYATSYGQDVNQVKGRWAKCLATGCTDCKADHTKCLAGGQPLGPPGEKGDKGDKGDQGLKGDKGDQGVKGDQGNDGVKGDQGAKGDPGNQGEQGIQGMQGEKGDKGDKGDQGEQGIQGPKGDKGDKGDKGEQGLQGLQGTQGEQGPVGPEASKSDSCPATSQKVYGQCIACDFSDPLKILVDTQGEYKCAQTTDALYKSGFGQDTRQKPRIWTRCLDLECRDCQVDFAKCSSCNSKYVLHGQQCISCDMSISTNVLVEHDSHIKCVDKSTAPYSTGYGLYLGITSHRLIKPCETKSCTLCSSDHTKCFGCKDRFTLTEISGIYTCATVEEKSESFPIPDSMIRRVPTQNKVDLSFPPAQSRAISKIEALDLAEGKIYPCATIGCKFTFKNDLLELSFDSPVQITQGQLNIYRGTTKISRLLIGGSSTGNRNLQADESTIVIKNFVLMKTSWYSVWTTVFQVVFFVYRLAGSILVFPRYPHLAMLCDRMINLSFVVSLLLGPLLPIPDFALHIVSSTRVPWYRLDNPFRNWNSPTLMCQTRPKYAEQGVLCSFLDNYGHDLLGFIGLTALFATVRWACRKLSSANRKGNSKTKDAAAVVAKYFDMQYLAAKLDANHMIIISTTLISFDLDDSSSKSVVGRGIALMLLTGFMALVYAAVRRALEKVRCVPKLRTDTQIAYIEKESDLLYAGPKTQLPSGDNTATFEWSKLQLISFTDLNCHDPRSRWQAFPVLLKYLRTISICILTLNFLEDALTQLVLVLLVQTTFIGYLFFVQVYKQRLELYSVLGVEALFGLFILLKAISTSTSISRDSRENLIGGLLGILVAMAALICLVFQTLAILIFRDDPNSSTPRPEWTLKVRNEVAIYQTPAPFDQQLAFPQKRTHQAESTEIDKDKEPVLQLNTKILDPRSDVNDQQAAQNALENGYSRVLPEQSHTLGFATLQGFEGPFEIPQERDQQE